MALTLSLAAATSGCVTFDRYDPQPTSPEQWRRRQEGIERREAERVRLCQMMNKESERYERMCTRPGDPR